MVLFLLAVERVADLHAVAGGQRDRGGYGQRNALISRAEHRVDVVRKMPGLDLLGDLLGVERTQRGDLATVIERAGVDEIRRLTP